MSTSTATDAPSGSGGDPLPDMSESRVFGHSDTHLALQIADVLISAILFPMACHTYADDLAENVHSHSGFAVLRERYGDRIRKLQLRFEGADSKWEGGVVVSNRRHPTQTGSLLFSHGRIPAQAQERSAAPALVPSSGRDTGVPPLP